MTKIVKYRFSKFTDDDPDFDTNENISEEAQEDKDLKVNTTYKEYFEKSLKTLSKDDARYYLIKIALQSPGVSSWSYILSPRYLEESQDDEDFNVITNKNKKKIFKNLRER